MERNVFRQAVFGLWCIVAASVTALMKFLEKQNAICLREILFNHALKQYLSGENRFYHQRLTDPAARMTQDTAQLAKESIHFIGHVLKPVIDITHLTTVLCGRLGVKPVAIFYSFFYFSQISIDNFKRYALHKPLENFTRDQMELEAAVRQRLNAIHTSREQIAFQQGHAREQADTTVIFERLARGARVEATQCALLDTVSSYTLKYGGMMTAFSVLMPNFTQTLR